MKIGIIGLGNIGKQHLRILNDLSFSVTALCDDKKDALKDFYDKNCYSDYIEMLDNEQLNVVHICTPHYLHAEMIIECLKRNINVICEKPLCINESDIQKILEAERESEAKLGICFQHRYDLSTIMLKDLLKGQKITSAFGRLFWNRNEKYYGQDKWRGKIATEGGGVLINQAIHVVDLMEYLLGVPDEIICFYDNISLKNIIEVEDTAVLNCFGKNDFTVFATNAADKDYEIEISINTEKDNFRLYQNRLVKNDKILTESLSDKKYSKACYGTGHYMLIKDFYDCLNNNKKFLIDGKEGAKAVHTVLSAYKSKGDRIKL